MSLQVLEIKPSTTNSSITEFDDPHTVVYLSQSNYTNADLKLLIWLPGSMGRPSNQMTIQKFAASQGYFVLGIQYVNGQTVGSICKKKSSSCYYETRVEIVTGEDTSSYISVSPTNSVLNRVTSLLNYLEANVDSVWGNFLSSPSSIDWNRTSVAGHSQGGGNAAVMAQLYPLQLAATFSAPSDDSDWTSTKSFATNASKVFGLIHYEDQGCRNTLSNWGGEGLAGPFFDFLQEVDHSSNEGFGASHTLCSTAPISLLECLYAHGSTAVDDRLQWQPNGEPVVQPAWQYMFSGGQPVVSGNGAMPTCSCDPCLWKMILALVGTLIALLIPPAIVAYAVHRTGKIPFAQLWKPVAVSWLIYLAISVSVVTVSIVSSSVISVVGAVGITGAMSGAAMLGLMWWWRKTDWWRCRAKARASLADTEEDANASSEMANPVGSGSSYSSVQVTQEEDRGRGRGEELIDEERELVP